MTDERLYTFRCPTCWKKFTYNLPGEPMCTGPGETDDHDPVVMRRIEVRAGSRTKLVSPEEGEARAKGTLLTPFNLIASGAKVDGELWEPPSDSGLTDEQRDLAEKLRDGTVET